MCFRKGKDAGSEKAMREDHVDLVGHCGDIGLYWERNQSLEGSDQGRGTSDLHCDRSLWLLC